MTSRRGVLAATLGLLCAPRIAMGDWLTLSSAEMAEHSDLIVVATLRSRSDNDTSTIGILEVGEVLKGTAIGPEITIVLPPRKRPMGLVASTDFTIPTDSAGLWYLVAEGNPDRYVIDRPDRFVPAAEAVGLIDALR
ncbi:hypothetical protein [Antarctobacter jejuensis]|uniref:hypothetical protein n=1 Tax=Antarctobacter jejuensis TaxID=1439938 RepID=UPI003FCF1067